MWRALHRALANVTRLVSKRDGASSRPLVTVICFLPQDQDRSLMMDLCRRNQWEVFFAVRDEFKRQGLPFSMPHVGHGMGIGLHEYPMLEPGNDTPLEVGMVINVEPMALIASRREGYHTEDLAAVTETGRRLLTPPQERLLVIPG